MSVGAMEDFDPKLVSTDRAPVGGTYYSVRYGGLYAGSVERVNESQYAGRYEIEQNGRKVTLSCGTSSTLKDAAEAVARQWLITNPLSALKLRKERFFIPLPDTETDADRDQMYNRMKQLIRDQNRWDVKDQKIYGVRFTRDRKRWQAFVGQEDSYHQGKVLAIFNTDGSAYILFLTNKAGRIWRAMLNKGAVDEVFYFSD